MVLASDATPPGNKSGLPSEAQTHRSGISFMKSAVPKN